jgi:biopolymer transport protein TolR
MKLKRFRRTIKTHSEINVTPLIDVMLVLLVIFMVTTPIMHSNISVNLPKAGPAVAAKTHTVPLTISIKSDGALFFQDKEVNPEVLLERLKILAPDQQETIYIEADKTMVYEHLVELMVALSTAGFSKLMLVTEAKIPEKKLYKGT